MRRAVCPPVSKSSFICQFWFHISVAWVARVRGSRNRKWTLPFKSFFIWKNVRRKCAHIPKFGSSFLDENPQLNIFNYIKYRGAFTPFVRRTNVREHLFGFCETVSRSVKRFTQSRNTNKCSIVQIHQKSSSNFVIMHKWLVEHRFRSKCTNRRPLFCIIFRYGLIPLVVL